jgi:hypothetical protein
MNENFYICVSGVLKSHFTLAMRSVLRNGLWYLKLYLKRAHKYKQLAFYYIQTKIWPSNTCNVHVAACEVTFLQHFRWRPLFNTFRASALKISKKRFKLIPVCFISFQDRVKLISSIFRAMNIDGSDWNFCRKRKNGKSQNSSVKPVWLYLLTFINVKIWSYF